MPELAYNLHGDGYEISVKPEDDGYITITVDGRDFRLTAGEAWDMAREIRDAADQSVDSMYPAPVNFPTPPSDDFASAAERRSRGNPAGIVVHDGLLSSSHDVSLSSTCFECSQPVKDRIAGRERTKTVDVNGMKAVSHEIVTPEVARFLTNAGLHNILSTLEMQKRLAGVEGVPPAVYGPAGDVKEVTYGGVTWPRSRLTLDL